MTQASTGTGFWNERFGGADYAYGDTANDFLRAHAGLFAAGSRILSLAEGEGRNGVFLAQQGCAVRGVDFSAEGRKKALQLAQARGVTLDYALADLTRYDMGGAAWDGVVSIFCHLGQAERPALHAAIKRALKPGGVLLLEAYNSRQLAFGTGGPKDPTHLIGVAELQDAFRGFDIMLAQEIERTVQEGRYHDGPSAVTQFIARKRG